MAIFDSSETVERLATQCLHYDNYQGCQYYLERVNVNGKCGLVCGEVLDDCGSHFKVLLEPIYDEIKVRKVSGAKAIYDRYEIAADGNKLGEFTLVLNAWVTARSQQRN